jgi:ABC-type dipeptide/oligopeptide/nickel transport system permease subunit
LDSRKTFGVGVNRRRKTRMKVLNWEMLKNPINYLIVGLMLMIAGFAGHEALSLMGIEPTGSSPPQNALGS